MNERVKVGAYETVSRDTRLFEGVKNAFNEVYPLSTLPNLDQRHAENRARAERFRVVTSIFYDAMSHGNTNIDPSEFITEALTPKEDK